jgi:hypothetical protein
MRACEGGFHLVQFGLILLTETHRLEFNVNTIYLAREPKRTFVSIGYRRAGVRSDAKGVDPEATGNSIVDSGTTHLLAIDPKDCLATFS